MSDKQLKVIIYHKWILKMGGVETFIYNFCVAMRDFYDITVMYETGDLYDMGYGFETRFANKDTVY